VAAEPNLGPHSFTVSKDNNLNKKHKDGNTQTGLNIKTQFT